MTKRKKVIWSISIIFVVVIMFFSGIGINKINKQIERNMAVDAAGAMPYQIGLTGARVIQCAPSCCSAAGCRCCAGMGGVLCATIMDVETRCPMYQEVQGTPAGGMGMNALFLQTSVMQAGLSPGGQLIAGGMSPPLMDTGVLASAGGCVGCVARSTPTKIKDFFKYVIASFKD